MTTIQKHMEDATDRVLPHDEKRRHLGASGIGDECGRKIFYRWRWFKTKGVFEPRVKRLFHRGHREEPELIALLRAAGVTVYAAGESGDNKEALRISDVDGHFGGTPDGVGVNVPDAGKGIPVLLEFKTANNDSFQKFVAHGVKETKWTYYVQMQIYMHKHELPLALFVVVNKNDDSLHTEIITYDPAIAPRYIQRAKDIIYAIEPPPRIADSPGRYPCKLCEFAEICHFPNINFPEVNCRTCTHGTVGANGAWDCAKGRVEIAEQEGCPEHLYEPRFFPDWTVIDGSFEENWLHINDGVSRFKMGPRIKGYTSPELYKDGLIPF